jgi:hypothetical protein
MTAPTEVDVAVQVSTYADTIPLTPSLDNVGLNATMHTVAGDDITYGILYHDTGREVIIVRKTSASETIMTVTSNACSQGFTTVHNVVAHMQAGDSTPTYKILGPFEPSRWATTYGTVGDAVTLRGKIVFTGTTTGLEVMILRVPICGD